MVTSVKNTIGTEDGFCPYVDKGWTIWRAGAGDLDGLAIGPLHRAVTITSAYKCIKRPVSGPKYS
jgi:hypothetical protein